MLILHLQKHSDNIFIMNINLSDNSNKLYYIGGVVRDEILGTDSFDIDLTFEGNAIEFAESLEGIEIIKVNPPFGTVRVRVNGEEVDIASTRAEIYEQPGHLPTVTKIGCDLREDVLRRDFTINALAKNYNSGEVIDYTGGLEDIKNKKLRVLHDRSFIDDPTRIIRALKFSVRFGFKLEDHTKRLRDKYLKNINYDMSYKRVKKELIETFNLNSQVAYEEFIKSDIYKLVTARECSLPEVNIENLVNKYKHLICESDIWLIYVGTLKDLSKLLLVLTREEKKIIEDYNSIPDVNLNDKFEIYQSFYGLRIETILLYAVLKNSKAAQFYLDNLKDIKLSITGEDLLNLGVKPSKKFKACFEFVLSEKLENPDMSFNDELASAKEFLRLQNDNNC